MDIIMEGLGALLYLIFWAVVILGVYFLPLIVAIYANHNQKAAIGVLNLFLGWTIIGWVVALVWACTKQTDKNSVSNADEIQKLADLKEKGLITEEEFNKKKAQILGLD